MRVFWRVMAALAVLVALGLAAAYFFRIPLAEAVMRRALADAGFENPAVEITALSASRLRLARLQAGRDLEAPDLRFDDVAVDFDIFRLLRDRAVDAVSAGPARIRLDINEAGAIRIAGAEFSGDGGSPADAPRLPFERLTLDEIEFLVTAPQGSGQGRLSGGYVQAEGGTFSLSARSEVIAAADWRAEAFDLAATARLAPEGGLRVEARAGGDFTTSAAVLRGLALDLEAQGGSWRELLAGSNISAFEGAGRLAFSLAEAPTSESAALAWLAEAGDERPARAVAAEGAIRFEFEDGAASVMPEAEEGSFLRLRTDRGDTAEIEALPGAPVYARDAGGAQQAAFALRADGPFLAGVARLSADSERAGEWRFDTEARLDRAPSFEWLSLDRAALSATGVFSGATLSADGTLDAFVRKTVLGPVALSDAPVSARLAVSVDFGAKQARVALADGGCASIAAVAFAMETSDSSGRLRNARLCPLENAALADVEWNDVFDLVFAGALEAAQGTARFGETRFAGAPPAVSVEGSFAGASGELAFEGRLKGGRMLLNDVIAAAQAEGRFALRAGTDGLSGQGRLSSVRLSQNAETQQVAPVLANGAFRLADERVDFDFAATTPGGAALGGGEGHHDIAAGRGAAVIRTGVLAFAAGGLQPSAVIPALKGVIGTTAGGASAEVNAAWENGAELKTSGRFALDNLSFRGPGLAVSRTLGLTGELELSSLAPLSSVGAQSVSVRLIDMDALQLESGTAIFELPGDETVRIVEAEFPWFGGRIGAYDTVAALTGERVTTALRAESVDLGRMLAFLNIRGLSGEGIVEGVLPVVIEDGRARIENGHLSAVGPGVLRYQGDAAEAAAAANEQAAMAFDILRNLRFSRLTALIDGPLDGDLTFRVVFEGMNEVTLSEQKVASPIIYRINLEAPILALIDQARVSTDFLLQYERLRDRAREP